MNRRLLFRGNLFLFVANAAFFILDALDGDILLMAVNGGAALINALVVLAFLNVKALT